MKLLLEFNDTAKLVIVHPTTGEDMLDSKDKPITITIYGTQSRQYRTAKNEALNKRMSRRGGQPTAEQIESDALELLAKCTASFSTPELGDVKDAKKIYRDAPWLKDQVDTGMADNALFLQTDSGPPEKS